MKKAYLLGALVSSILCSQAAFAGCKPLNSKNFIVVYGERTPLSQILEESIKGTGWKLEYSVRSSEPYVRGEIRGRVGDVVTGLVQKAIQKGWKINLSLNEKSCTIRADVLNAMAPHVPGASGNAPDTIRMPDAKHTSSFQRPTKGISTFAVRKGERLSAVLKRWAQSRNGDVIWKADRDFIIKADASYHGDLPGVIEALLNSMGSEVSDRIIVTVFQNGYIRVDDAEDFK